MSRPKAYLTMHRVAYEAEAPIRKGLRLGFALFRQRLSDALVGDAMMGVFQTVDRVIPWNHYSNTLHGPIRQGLLDAASHAAKEGASLIPTQALKKSAGNLLTALGFRFDMTNERAVRWAEREAAQLVINLEGQTREAVRLIIVRMFRDGVPPAEAARMLRGIVGLDPRYALAVDNLRRTLTAQGRELDDVAAKVTAYAARLERARATNIARTESMGAANAGQQELWRQARDQGILSGDAKRQWILTPDERLCEICAPVPSNGPVGLEELFTLGDGDQVLSPPAHPQCRCAVRLVFA